MAIVFFVFLSLSDTNFMHKKTDKINTLMSDFL